MGRRALAGLVVLVACLALAGGLALGISAARTPSGAASGSPIAAPSAANASPSAAPTLPPSASPRPSVSPTPGATATAVEATVVARVPNCQNPLGWDYAVSGNDLFVVCDALNAPSPYSGPGGPYIVRVDLTTSRVTATYRYKTPMTYIEGLTVENGGLWFEGIFGGSGCSGDCRGWRRVDRFDIATGKTTVEIPDVGLVGSSSGYIWVRDSLVENGPLRKLDPKTGREAGRIPFNMGGAQFACGSFWGTTGTTLGTPDTTTTVAHIDPVQGTVLASFTLPGRLRGLESVGKECWATVEPGGDDPYTAYYADHFVRIGNSGVEDSSPIFQLENHSGTTSEAYLDIQAGSFWLVHDDGVATATLQRVDPLTWQPTGTQWQTGASGYQGDPFAIIGGSVWVFDNDGGISRLDIPLGS